MLKNKTIEIHHNNSFRETINTCVAAAWRRPMQFAVYTWEISRKQINAKLLLDPNTTAPNGVWLHHPNVKKRTQAIVTRVDLVNNHCQIKTEFMILTQFWVHFTLHFSSIFTQIALPEASRAPQIRAFWRDHQMCTKRHNFGAPQASNLRPIFDQKRMKKSIKIFF